MLFDKKSFPGELSNGLCCGDADVAGAAAYGDVVAVPWSPCRKEYGDVAGASTGEWLLGNWDGVTMTWRGERPGSAPRQEQKLSWKKKWETQLVHLTDSPRSRFEQRSLQPPLYCFNFHLHLIRSLTCMSFTGTYANTPFLTLRRAIVLLWLILSRSKRNDRTPKG